MDIKKRDFLVGGAMLGAGAAMSGEAAAQPATVFPAPQPITRPEPRADIPRQDVPRPAARPAPGPDIPDMEIPTFIRRQMD